MSFEDDLRTTLQSEAGDLDLRGRGATEVMHLARRRQHRARRVGAVAAVGVLGVGVVGAIAARRTDGVAVTSVADQVDLPDVGPLELSWQRATGGITGGTQGEPRFTEDAGALYALSTAPGARYPEDGSTLDPALYRLADDGTWVVASTDGAVPMVDLAADGSVLYAIGTAPGSGAVGYDSVLSSSVDGGATWAPTSIAPVAPPSTVVAWRSWSSLAIERVPGATVAVVSTVFSPPQSLVDQAVAAAGAEAGQYHAEITDAGIEVVAYVPDGVVGEKGRANDPAPTTAPPADPPRSGAAVPTPPGTVMTPYGPTDGTTVSAEPTDEQIRSKTVESRTVLTSIPWAEIGLTGRGDLTATQVLVEREGAWVPVDSSALADLSVTGLTVAGQDLVVHGWVDGGQAQQALWSSDGLTWYPVAVGEDSRIGGLGNVWVDLPAKCCGGAPVVRGSVDRGASWTTIDLGAVDGRLASASVTSFDSGALGLAAIAVDHGDEAGDPVSYLVTTRDLRNWTVTPLAEVTGSASAGAAVHVGADRIVVTASEGYVADSTVLPASVTAIGTPVR
jgi:hypothetical protein